MEIIKTLKRIKYHIFYYNLTKRFTKMDLPRLTKVEKAKIRETWPGVHIYEMDFVHARLFKKIHGFSPYYLSPCWYNEIRNRMNPKDQLSKEEMAMIDSLDEGKFLNYDPTPCVKKMPLKYRNIGF